MSLTLSGSGTIGGLVAGGLPDATVTNAELVTMDGAKVTGNVAAAQITAALNASGSAPVYACRAWVNFNGTGTVSIRASGNVSSITDNGTGNPIINFTTAMPDANYTLSFSGSDGSWGSVCYMYSMSSSSVQMVTLDNAGTNQRDLSTVTIAIFR